MKLQESRQKIDAINKELIRLFEERLSIVVDIARYKEEHQMQIHDAKREEEVLNLAVTSLNNPDLEDYAKEFMGEVIRICKEYEKNHIHQHIFLILLYLLEHSFFFLLLQNQTVELQQLLLKHLIL